MEVVSSGLSEYPYTVQDWTETHEAVFDVHWNDMMMSNYFIYQGVPSRLLVPSNLRIGLGNNVLRTAYRAAGFIQRVYTL